MLNPNLHKFTNIPTIIGDRAFPPVSVTDTIFQTLNGSIRGEHETREKFIEDRRVIKIKANHTNWTPALDADATPYLFGKVNIGPKYIEFANSRIPVFCQETEDQRVVHLLPQLAQRSCVYASSAMLLLDACTKYKISNLWNLNIFENVLFGTLANDNNALNAINGALAKTNYHAVLTIDEAHFSLAKLERKSKLAPASISIGSDILGGHRIILDSIGNSEQGMIARIRDPFHAWDINIKFSYLRKMFLGPIGMIQIKEKR